MEIVVENLNNSCCDDNKELSIINKNKTDTDPLRAMNKGDGPYHGFGNISLFSDPISLATWSQREILYFATFNRAVDTKTSII